MTDDRFHTLYMAITDSKYSHSRSRNFCGWVTHIYHRDHTSPSGVICVGGDDASIVDPLIRYFRNNSPLSPTEGL
jgi:hypothetical protein